jgi:hypothetical protein
MPTASEMFTSCLQEHSVENRVSAASAAQICGLQYLGLLSSLRHQIFR